ncbi:MAG TPA: DNA gyrase subunit A [Clostridia bacterium]|jgi:DNA gyrase subunit A|nr:DNA gyrase subunit A [Clostridia bacterium]HOL61286.1 DNA gyrase subunit A [Clostridia bacterium]HPO53649.1 DNA gyrase subunit A [Clostridia bacterium]
MEKSKIDINKIKETLSKTKIVPVDVRDEMAKSFISYAMAVNVSRAIPDVRDGLKPVQRRILYAMYELGNTHDKPYKKCARIVGEVLGKYHPHGDSAVYDALVRMGQDFSIRATLIDGHGNFGSVDGDPPAAQRYTEARLSKIAGELLRDLDKDTVDYYPNFDDTLMQPTVLPAKYPNLLVNGSEGIAVGMATSIPPHNLAEVINGTIALIDNPDITIDELMEHIPCPDYPTGGIILGRMGIRQAYMTGKGSIVIRSKCEIEEHNGRNRIVVTEIPYQVNKANLVKEIADQVKDKRLEGISDIREESDRFGMRIVIELKRDAQPQVVLNTLYKQTNLQVSNGIIFLALVDGVPKVLNLKEMLSSYIAHQIVVVERRTRYLLAKALEKEHILKGLVIALANIDEVIEIIKNSKERSDAQKNLIERFELSEKQANAILDTRLARLTSLEVEKINEELAALTLEIADYREILEKPERVRAIIKNELAIIRNSYSDKRRSELSYDIFEIDIADLIEQKDVVISMTYHGYVKRISVDEYKTQNRGGMGITAHKTKDEDFVQHMFVCNTHDDLLFFSNKGKVYCLKAFQVPEAARAGKGRAVVNLLPLTEDEKITAFLPIKSYETGYMIMATRNGLIKKCDLREFENIRSNGKIAITLTEDDELIVADITTGEDEILMASSDGKCIRFKEEDVRPTGRGSQGVRSIKLDEGDAVVDMAVIKEGCKVVTVTENGYGKRSDLDDYRLQGRGGKGIKAGTFTEKTGRLVNLKLVDEEHDLIIIADNGIMIRIAANSISNIGRNTQGVRLMRLKDGAKVVAMALTPHEEDAEYDEIDGEPADDTPAENAAAEADQPAGQPAQNDK